eukprot:CAMPEP_0204565128 /NCGR_PEP_ID=MMETSP0661-20131031/35291_1 /ASSEMBLY_ACC=CAM_ASM_000606 /TAXON_ID=109239 /ORGANISM="Alexandrium margalefi, Strain AMGDE01CS-322" /LENGTH=245 /DNA_ID=CAMNT_0051572845 /DNA_START=56 /DNA_END=793 /DNA_ORIENTATION=+
MAAQAAGASGRAPMELEVDLGPMPVDDHSGGVIQGLRLLLDRGELCDVVLVAGGQSLLAHRAVLAAVSSSFHECLTQIGPSEGNNPESLVLKLDDISHPEAVRAMLDCIYGPAEGAQVEYSPTSEEANRDVLRLAQRFQIAQLQDDASRWLLKGLSTANVLGRLMACEEFGMVEVREKILEQLTANPEALFVLAKDPEVTKVPAVLQDLLVRILKLLGAEPGLPATAAAGPGKASQGKPARKAGA